jgi:hypothetical protein
MENKKKNDYLRLTVRMFDSVGEEIFHKDTPLHQVHGYLYGMCNTYIITDVTYTTREPRNILGEEDNL